MLFITTELMEMLIDIVMLRCPTSADLWAACLSLSYAAQSLAYSHHSVNSSCVQLLYLSTGAMHALAYWCLATHG